MSYDLNMFNVEEAKRAAAKKEAEVKKNVRTAVGIKDLVYTPGLHGKVMKSIPSTGDSLSSSGTKVSTILLPREGIWYGPSAAVFYDQVVTSGGTECRFALGHTACNWEKIYIYVGKQLVQSYDRFNLLAVQKLKFEKCPDFYTGLGSAIGYYSSEQSLKDDTNRVFMPLPDGCLLGQILPLGSMDQVKVVLTLDSETNNYTVADNGETNTRTVTISNISIQSMVIQDDPTGKDFQGHITCYNWQQKPLASSSTSKIFTLSVNSDDVISGVEGYIRADADIVNHDNYNKLWSTKLAGTTKIQAALGGTVGTEESIEADEGAETAYHALLYNGYRLNDIHDRAFCFASATWAGESGEDTAGDFTIQISFAGVHNKLNAVSGHVDNPENLHIKWFGNADEACTVDFYVRSQKAWVVKNGNFMFK